MKAIVTGLILIAVSGGALIWHLVSRSASVPPAGPVRTAKCMVWKAERGKAVVWLCGSFHLLREEDYPLPAPYLQAFEEAKVIVMESHHDPATAAERQEKIAALGRVPEGETLQQHLSPEAWKTLAGYCNGDGPALVSLQSMRPWKAAFHLSNHHMARLGYSAARGLESHFSALAGSRRLAGLETLAAENIAAWREGDTRRLAALHEESMASIPALKQMLFHDRHAAWMPKLEQYLDGSETVMVLVGSLHLCGNGSLIELLEAKGVKLTQQEYRTTRPPEPAEIP
jgi:uncharacterized protein YbaP (TraB family)